jgi:hypothetical protein
MSRRPLLALRPAAVLVLLAALLASLTVPVPADAAPRQDLAAQFIESVNVERARQGLPRLRRAADLDRVALRHSGRMADRGSIYHNPNLGSDVTGWTRLSENVGRGPSVSSLHNALMNSTGHRRNILDSRVSQIGVGVEQRGSTIWVTQVFRAPRSESPIRFRDVSSNSVHRGSIHALAERGIATGCSDERFCPNQRVTRAQMATFLARAELLLPRASGPFRDLGNGDVHAGSVNATANAGITSGCRADRYCPDRTVTRAQMATLLVNALGLSPRSGSRFRDVPADSLHARNIEALAHAGITSGCARDRFCPDDPVSRAEMATFLQRAYR